MEPLKEGDGFRLSTGRQFYANCNTLGISSDLGISEGYDGGIEGADRWSGKPFTPEERLEIASYMVDLWTRWGLGEGESP